MAKERKLTPPLKWTGGKGYLASWIVDHFPKHRHYAEAYGGGLSPLFARDPGDERFWVGTGGGDRGVSEVVNDLNGGLINFWRALRDPKSFARLQKLLAATPLARQSFDESAAWLKSHAPKNPGVGEYLPHAYHFFVCARQSHAGGMKGFTSLTRNRTRRGVNGNASEWLGAIDGLPSVHARLQPVVIEGPMDALKFIEREDTKDTLHYLDPPYLHETRASTKAYGDFEVDADHHRRLLELLARIRGKFVLSGYRSKLYDDFARKRGWNRDEKDIANHAAGGAAKRRMVECIWFNYTP